MNYQRPFGKMSGRGENGVLRAPERSVLEAREHRSAEERHLQTALTLSQMVSQSNQLKDAYHAG